MRLGRGVASGEHGGVTEDREQRVTLEQGGLRRGSIDCTNLI